MISAEKLLKELNGFADVYKGLGAEPKFQCLVQSLKEEIALGEQKKSGKPNRFKAALKFSKMAKKLNTSRPGIAGAYIGEAGKQYIMIAAMAVRYDNPYEGLVMAEDGTQPSLDRAIDSYDKNLKVELPSVAELKTELKLNKAEGKLNPQGRSMTQIEEAFYDTEYLINLVEAVEPEEAYFSCKGKTPGLTVIGDGAQGVLLPIRP